MVQSKYLLGISILSVVLISGCLNSNAPTQKAQPTNEPKVINLNAKQIILDDTELKDLFGVILTKDENIIPESDQLPVYYSVSNNIHSVHILSGINNVYALKKSDNSKYNISIGVYVFPTVDNAKYFESKIIDSNQNIKVIKNVIDLGNTTGNLDSVVRIAPLFSWSSDPYDCPIFFISNFIEQNYGLKRLSFECGKTNDGRTINIEYKVYNNETYLFDWDEVPGNDNKKFINYLRNEYKSDWIETAKIEKINDNKTIRAFNSENLIEFNLDNSATAHSETYTYNESEINNLSYLNSPYFARRYFYVECNPPYSACVDNYARYIYKIVKNNFSLILNDEKTKVNLKTYDGRFNDEFYAKKEDNTLNIYKQSKLLTDLNVGDSVIIFSKNNIMIIIRSNPDVKIETLLELAKKQDGKISRILDMIK